MRPASPGTNWIVGGAATAVLLPALAIGVGMPFWIAGIISATAGGGLAVLLSPRKPFDGLDASGVARSKIEFARELLTDAEPLAVRLEVAVSSIRTVTGVSLQRRGQRLREFVVSAVEPQRRHRDIARRQRR